MPPRQYVHAGVTWNTVRVLGKGSFGEAHLVQDANAPSHQAVCKLVHVSSMKTEERKAARNEVVVLSRLKHPNIIEYYDSFEEGGTLHILMEYANSGDVDALMKSRASAPFSQEEVLNLFVQMCHAVRYLHERRILHRDLKCQNVFLSKGNDNHLVVKIGDFGISTVLRTSHALAKTVCGTPYYFSPELCLNKPYNNKSDVWSLGCILYELCTLKHAFEGTSMKALVQRILKGTYSPIPKQYSPSLMQLIDAMLQQRVERRFCIQQVLAHPLVEAHVRQMCGLPPLVEPPCPPDSKPMKPGLPPKPSKTRHRDEVQNINEIKQRVEVCSYDAQQPYVKEGWRVVQEVQRNQSEREKAAAEREANVELLKKQMEAIDQKMRSRRGGQPTSVAGPPPVHSPPTANVDSAPLNYAKARRFHVSEDAPWNAGRDAPVGFTPDSWEAHKRAMAKAPSRERVDFPQHSAAQQLAPQPQVLPDPVFQGRKGYVEVDVDAVLHRESASKAQTMQPHEDEVQSTAAQERAAALWAQQKERIRQASGMGGPTMTEAELLWELQRNKIASASGPLPPSAYGNTPSQPTLPPQPTLAPACPKEYEGVLDAMRQPSDLPDPPELFEEAPLPENEVSRLSNTVKFTLDGKTLHIRGVESTDPLPLRVEALRLFLRDALGGPRSFDRLYRELGRIQVIDDVDEADAQLHRLESEYGDKSAYVDLMVQLMVCEAACGPDDP